MSKATILRTHFILDSVLSKTDFNTGDEHVFLSFSTSSLRINISWSIESHDLWDTSQLLTIIAIYVEKEYNLPRLRFYRVCTSLSVLNLEA
ncbi:hypothetical protein BgiMline_034524 [Biomphalaria glabrata]